MIDLTPILNQAHNYQEIIIVGSRGEGKTYTTAHWLLPQIEENEKKFLWLRRYPDDSRQSLLDYFRKRVSEYCQKKGYPKSKQEKLWEVIVRGTFYEKDNKIIFSELEHYNNVRGLFDSNPNLIIFDEAIPTLLDWRTGYLKNEPEKFRDLWNSTWRDKSKPKPTILHLTNAYDRTFHRLKDWDKEIDVIANKGLWKQGDKEDWYWEKDKEIIDFSMQKLVKKKLVFYRKKGDGEGWPVFFTKKGDFNVKEIKPHKLTPLEVYNNKFLLARPTGGDALYFTYVENFPVRRKLVDYHLDSKTFFLTPPHPCKELLTKEQAKSKKKEWAEWINSKVLIFSNFDLRQEIIELLS
ncbi:MAG: DNA encapsidation ATPase [Mycoplasmataceae bacterium RV_VA103A]|nr:MAG: DNA encapsidation ATPase [Mycoplasmataceae bacterium RV_VA103A]